MRLDWMEKEMLYLCENCLPQEAIPTFTSDCNLDHATHQCDLCNRETSPAYVISVYNALRAMSQALQKTAPVVECERVKKLEERFDRHQVEMETHRIVSFLRKEQGKDGQEWFHRKVLEIWTNPPWISTRELDAALKQLLASKTIETKKFKVDGKLADAYRLTETALKSEK